MTFFTPKYITFAKLHMRDQGAEIIEWSKSDNPLLAQTCREIIEASQQGKK